MPKFINKKISTSIIGLMLIFVLFAPVMIYAATPTPVTAPVAPTPAAPVKPDETAPVKPDSGGGQGLVNKDKVQLVDPLTGDSEAPQVYKIINNIISTLLGLTGVLALIAFIYGGILWMVSFGDPGRVEKGKKMMIWAVIGLVVVFSSYAILTLVFQAFGFAAKAG